MKQISSNYYNQRYLSSQSSVANDNILLYKKDTIYSKPIAKLEAGRLVLIKKCKIKWCKIKTENFGGWVLKSSLWGKVK